jgi:hypothetical protein
LNSWHHVAITRSGSKTREFVDGQAFPSAWDESIMTPIAGGSYLVISGAPCETPGAGDNGDFNGYIDELRVVNGVAVWTSNFTPPTAPYTATNVFPVDAAAPDLLPATPDSSGAGGSGGTASGGVTSGGGSTITGGTTGTGGAVGSGGAGSGGCSNVVATGSPGLIDDLNHAGANIPHNDGRQGYWFTWNDGTGTQTPPGMLGGTCQATTFAPTNGQACTSGSGFTVSGAGIGFGVDYGPNCVSCNYDATAYKGGVRFTISGIVTGNLRFVVTTAEVTPVEFGGLCPDAGDCPVGGLCNEAAKC